MFATGIYSNQTDIRHSGEDRNPSVEKPQNIRRPYSIFLYKCIGSLLIYSISQHHWIPAFAGMTNYRLDQTNTRHSGEDQNPSVEKPQNSQRPCNKRACIFFISVLAVCLYIVFPSITGFRHSPE